ncbi:MAG: ComEA family DNA-binding protein [Fimbriimonadia bacterium]|jgi:competence ComEA-like helix-hairpin-helix protein
MISREHWDRWAPGERLVVAIVTACLMMAAAFIAFRTPPAEQKTPSKPQPPSTIGRVTQPSPKVGPVSINTAGQAELETLPGIGPDLAREIVQDRIRNGPFFSVDQLKRVKGIGPRKLEELRSRIRL